MKRVLVCYLFLVSLFLGVSQVYAESIMVKDSRGTELVLEASPSKVVVLGYAEYDTLRTLGLKNIIVGAPKSNTPAYIGEVLESITDIGSLKEPNVEEIATLAPDLIIANGRTAELVSELEKIAPVFVFSIDTNNYWESFVEQNIALATLFDKTEEAANEIAELETLVTSVKTKNDANEEKTLMLMLNEGNISAFSVNSRFSLIYKVLGFKPVDAEIEDSRHGQAMSYEGILSLNPERIFYIDRTVAIGGDTSSSEAFEEQELLKQTIAGKNGNITALSSDLWYLGGGGLESVRKQIEEIAEILK